jgi:hypothetical protein
MAMRVAGAWNCSNGGGGGAAGALLADGTVTGATTQAQVFTNGITAAVNKVTLTAPATAATITVTNNKTLAVTNTLTLSGTDSTIMTFPSVSASIPGLAVANTFSADQSFSGQVLGKVGNTPSSPAFAGIGGTNAGLWFRSIGTTDISSGGAGMVDFAFSLGLLLTTGAPTLAWTGSSTVGSGGRTAISEVSAGRIGVGSGGAAATDGWLIDAGHCFVTANQTNATTTMSSSTCSMTVKTGLKYVFRCNFFVSDSVAADGAKIDFNGGTATATDFRAQITAFDSALNLSTQVSALATAAAATTFTGSGSFEVNGSFEPSANGTFIPQFAQNAHTTGTLTLFRGSHCRIIDTP